MTNACRDSASNRASGCPDCGNSNLTNRGRLPEADYFAGRSLEQSLPGGSLFECKSCGLNFRWPRLTKEEADALYCDGEEENWDSPAEMRPDWQMARQWIEELGPGMSVLDIACFDGRFLGILDSRHERFGIEIHAGAAQRARDRGINIVASDLAELSQIDRKFSVVTAFDILEHVHEPQEFLARIAEALEPGGIAIIGTGNSHAASWKFMGTHYWYCSNLEHVSFINPRWCHVTAEKLELDVARIAPLSHCYPTVTKICRETIMNGLFRMAPGLMSTIRCRVRAWTKPHKRNSRNEKPAWFSAKDHLLVTFQKPTSENRNQISRPGLAAGAGNPQAA